MDRDPPSLRIASIATLVALPLGIALAWLLARANFWGKALLDALVHLPLVLPPVVTGYLLLLTLRPARPGRRLPRRPFRHRVRVPLDRRGAGLRRHGVSAAGAADPPVDRSGRPQAGAGRGHARRARRWRVFVTVTLPLALPGVLAGMVLGFAKALGEFGATITFVSNIPGETQTISSAIYSLTQTPGGDAAALRLVVVSIVIALARADRLGMVRPPRRHAPARELIMLARRCREDGSASSTIEVTVRERGPRHWRCSAPPAPARPR